MPWALFLPLVGCGPQTDLPDPDPAEVDIARFAVAHGDPDPGHPEVGSLDSGCTATLVGRRTVLTAAHCIHSPALPLQFVVAGQASHEALSATQHPKWDEKSYNFSDYDIAVVRLKEKVPGVLPAQLCTRAAKAAEKIVLVGFGIPGNSGLSGTKRTGINYVSQVQSYTFTHKKDGKRTTTCEGDSGGPVFVTEGGKKQVAGVHSAGTRPCEATSGYGIHVRVDAHYSWVSQLAQGDLYKGEAIDVQAPEVKILSPQNGDEIGTSVQITTTITDNVGVDKVLLLLDDKEVEKKTSPPYTFELKNLARECYDIEVAAYDKEGSRGADKVNVCVASGASFGEKCADADACASGKCVGTAPDRYCTKSCTASLACPDGYTCDTGNGMCQKEAPMAERSGCAVGSTKGKAPSALFLLLLLLLFGLRTKRAKRRPR